MFPSKRSASGHLNSICNLFRQARNEAGLPKELVLSTTVHEYWRGQAILRRSCGRWGTEMCELQCITSILNWSSCVRHSTTVP